MNFLRLFQEHIGYIKRGFLPVSKVFVGGIVIVFCFFCVMEVLAFVVAFLWNLFCNLITLSSSYPDMSLLVLMLISMIFCSYLAGRSMENEKKEGEKK